MQVSDPSDRVFRWMSSVRGDAATLGALDEKMGRFYSRLGERARYQAMLDTQQEALPASGTPGHAMLAAICKRRHDQTPQVLEVGCGSGRLYRHLKEFGLTGQYSGTEVASHVIEQNRVRHPEANWKCAGAYEIPFSDGAFDVCFAFYVLEHLVWPERALREMLRVVRPGGSLLLAFPDFVSMGLLASQQTGFSAGGAGVKLRKGRVVDAVVSLYDSRVRLPGALRQAVTRHGPFPVNLRPICLSHPELMWPDVDGVYIASKSEVAQWAIENGHEVAFPAGTCEPFDLHAFVRITK